MADSLTTQTDGSPVWEKRINVLLDRTLKVFFPDGIAYEIACETHRTCTTDMLSFKGYVARWLSTMTKMAPYTAPKVRPILKTSAAAAVKQCTGGTTGRACGFSWSSGTFDGQVGAGQTMNVLAAVSSLLIDNVAPPLTAKTGGTSKPDFVAGTGGDTINVPMREMTTADRAGAGILTVLILVGGSATFWWMSTGL